MGTEVSFYPVCEIGCLTKTRPCLIFEKVGPLNHAGANPGPLKLHACLQTIFFVQRNGGIHQTLLHSHEARLITPGLIYLSRRAVSSELNVARDVN